MLMFQSEENLVTCSVCTCKKNSKTVYLIWAEGACIIVKEILSVCLFIPAIK